jgi:ABC-type uncharacterized transport system ATPase subunit
MASVEEVCSHITLINKGRAVVNGTLEEVRAQFGSVEERVVVRQSLSMNEIFIKAVQQS